MDGLIYYSIQAVESRTDSVAEILKEVPSANVFYDTEMNGTCFNLKRIFEAFLNTESEYLVNFQDDVILSKNITTYINKLIVENKIVGLSLMAVGSVAENGNIIKSPSRWFSMQGSIMSRMLVEKTLSISPQGTMHDDWWVRDALFFLGSENLAHNPSIVQHDLSIKSSLNHDIPWNCAEDFCEDCSTLMKA